MYECMNVWCVCMHMCNECQKHNIMLIFDIQTLLHANTERLMFNTECLT